MNYLYLAICWLGYFIIHSVFALNQVKKLFYSAGMNPASYRLVYNIFNLLLLVPIFFYSSSINDEFIFTSSFTIKVTGLLVSGYGIVIVKLAFRSYNTRAFLGLGNIEKENELRTDGLLQYVRHPLYTGSILVVLGYFLIKPTIGIAISVGMVILYFIVGIRFEERKLIKLFGDLYVDYKKKTPMLIPRIKIWK